MTAVEWGSQVWDSEARQDRSSIGCAACPHDRVPADEYFLTIAENLAHATPGERNSQLNQASYSIGRWQQAGNLDLSWWRDKLISSAEENGEAFTDRREVTGTIESGFKAGALNPHKIGQVEEQGTRLQPAFWNERTWLRHIKRAALSAGRSEEALLLTFLARYSCLVDHRFTLPGASHGVVGKAHASLNLLTLLVGHAGQGKGDITDHARELLPREVKEVPLGSGEGLAQAFFRYEKVEKAMVWRREYESILVVVNEGHLLMKLAQRDGQTTDSTLRSAYSGETLGGTYRSNPCVVDRGTYRMGLILAVQPEVSSFLLSEEAKALGTTSRLLCAPLWTRGHVNPLEKPRPKWPGELKVSTPQVERGVLTTEPWLSDKMRDVEYAPRVTRQVLLEDFERQQRDGSDPMTAHSTLTTLKVAALTSLLEGRVKVEWEDFQLASKVVGSSSRTLKYMERESQKHSRHEVESRARTSALFDTTKSEVFASKAAKAILRNLTREWSQMAQVKRSCMYYSKEQFEQALSLLESQGKIEVESYTSRGRSVRRVRLTR